MTVSREQMRAEFIRNKNEPAQGPQWEAMVAGIDEATDMLVHEIIRGDLNDDSGRYRTYYSNHNNNNVGQMARHACR